MIITNQDGNGIFMFHLSKEKYVNTGVLLEAIKGNLIVSNMFFYSTFSTLHTWNSRYLIYYLFYMLHVLVRRLLTVGSLHC